uniref:Cysteine dioxygenase n=1 Tax=Romanomermis culicivorax TaxID=13658 RepID=A0A915KFT3_ROMCU
MGLLQQIAVKAYHFAKGRASGAVNAASPEFQELRRLVDAVTLRDCNLDPDRALFSHSFYENESYAAPCFATPIYEDEFLHMSIFGCRSPNGYIPLHDHKGWTGFFLKMKYFLMDKG